ncbi:type II toxin-antitoxin system RelE/ParE family toxin [Rhizobium panacihumi]|uniref:type II toxin-antitoxin system RelE/ParE family toxin n=1 Tax=Rhizobium panacihumi TaxID=2008450 RepID=UPI003D78C236
MNYVLTDDAEADLRGIVRHTRKEWGAKQVRNYVSKLKTGIACVAAGQGAFKELDALYPKLRMARCEHHYVFCLPRENAPALIVAILHERMDLMVRLVGRLND